jgi:propionyl-CoA carboxylase alpha chain
VFIEKFILDPRHIEIQVLGDQQGNIVYLGERECSIQRRHQKVVEEAPSPFVTPAMRKAMGEQAVALARAVGYHSAGTVELIVSGADTTGESFYFLEMNTRLQVEHPVTEEVTGLDLVEQMIRVAAGEKLAFTQDDVKLDGWAIETRVYAEDPYRGFLPSTGRLVRYRPPLASLHQCPFASSPSTARRAGAQDELPPAAEVEKRSHAEPGFSTSLETNGNGEDGSSSPRDAIIRVDDGVVEGGEVSMFYDPMIAKLVTWAPTRLAAIDRQIRALDAFRIDGIGHNVDFLSAVMQHPRFRAGNLSTGFIAEEYPEGFAGAPADAALLGDLAAIAALIEHETECRAAAVSDRLHVAEPSPSDLVVRIRGGEHRLKVESVQGATLIHREGEAHPQEILGAWRPGQLRFNGEVGGRPQIVQIARAGRHWRLTARGASHRAEVLPAHVAELSRHMIEKAAPDLSKYLICPMPGLLTRLDVGEGDAVEAGQPLALVEAMKMENILRAEKAGRVKRLAARPGDSLAVDAVILEFE